MRLDRVLHPQRIVVSGAPGMRDELVGAGLQQTRNQRSYAESWSGCNDNESEKITVSKRHGADALSEAHRVHLCAVWCLQVGQRLPVEARTLIQRIKLFFPGSIPCFVGAVAVSTVLLARRASRRGGASVGIVSIAFYLVLSLPWTAERLSSGFTRSDRLTDPRQAREAALLVLGGDRQDLRIVEAVRLDRVLHPQWIVVSGAPGMRDELVEAGVHPDRIVMETSARNTREQAANVAALLRAGGIARVVLVASVIHMPRALAAVRGVGVDAIPSASGIWQVDGLPRFWPANDARRLSRDVLYERAALRYYRWRGWL